MLNLYILTLLERDIGKLKEEIRLYTNEKDIWKIAPGTSNSTGTLTLHLCGNLRHFIGNEIGKTGYIRDRDAEFSTRDLPVGALIALIETTMSEIKPALNNLSQEQLKGNFPKEIGGIKRDTAFVLLHLLGHFSYHLGQINYHRRIISATAGHS